MSLRVAVIVARQLGWRVEPIRRTGELGFWDPSTGRRMRVNGRRKDAPRVLRCALQRVAALTSA